MEKKYNDEKYNGMSYGCFSKMYDFIDRLDHRTRGTTFEERIKFFTEVTADSYADICGDVKITVNDGLEINLNTLLFLMFKRDELTEKAFLDAFEAFIEDCRRYASK